jgi:hypothetical protein
VHLPFCSKFRTLPHLSAGVTSYIVVVWDEPSAEACSHLNFPCFNAAAWLPASVSNKEAKYRDANFISIM